MLAAEEIARAGRFRSDQDRARYVAGRVLLRQVLGRYADRAPESLRFGSSQHGKPGLQVSAGTPCLHFNASGSASLALVAVRGDADVGVDIERVRSFPDAPALARRMLTDAEYIEFSGVPESARDRRFLEYWVRKEAVSKALGLGLRQSFGSLSLHPWPGDAELRVESHEEGCNASHWVIPLRAPHSDYVAALAASAPIGGLRCWTWSPRLAG